MTGEVRDLLLHDSIATLERRLGAWRVAANQRGQYAEVAPTIIAQLEAIIATRTQKDER